MNIRDTIVATFFLLNSFPFLKIIYIYILSDKSKFCYDKT